MLKSIAAHTANRKPKGKPTGPILISITKEPATIQGLRILLSWVLWVQAAVFIGGKLLKRSIGALGQSFVC